MAGRARGAPRLGRPTPFRLEASGDPVFDRRLVLPGLPGGGVPGGGWIVLSYAGDPLAPPLRPMVRVLRGPDAAHQDFVLPGAAHGLAHWLGLIPPDAAEIRLAAGAGFVLERVGLRSEGDVLGQCLLRRPWRFVSALVERARGSERRYRDILRGACAVTPMARYPAWIAGRHRPMRPRPTGLAVRCLVPARAGEEAALSRTVASLVGQTHAAWSACIAWDAAPTIVSAEPRLAHRAWDPGWRPADLIGQAGALCVLAPGDVLAPDALGLLAAALADADLRGAGSGGADSAGADSAGADSAGADLAGTDLAYADAEDAYGRPQLKPDWSPDLALASGYVGRPALLAPRLLGRMPAGPVGPMDGALLALDVAAMAACARAVHVPRILARTAAPAPDPAARARALDACLALRPAPPRAVLREGAVDLLWPLPEPAPRVSVVIPSRDRLDLIGRVCRGVLAETAYPAIELIVVDNGSTDPAVLAHYEALRADPRVTILAYPHPFDFAAMVNAGVEAASGAVVVLLNNDVAVLEPGWLEAMVRQAMRPEVGAVGARLLYGDGRLQHAGVVVGLGGRAGHILRRRAGDTPGHLGRLRVAHEVSAVTAACLAVRRATYRAVDGLDADAFPIDFNDVDFCLRLGKAGWKTVWTPAATLAHLESTSRGPSVGPKRARFEAEAARFEARWRDAIRHDPFYHPALSLTTFGEDLE